MTANFRIGVSFSAGSNDHQVRYLVDGADLIASMWDDMLGLDPDEILTQPCPLLMNGAHGAVTVARCGCGVTGCSSKEVTVSERAGVVEWLSGGKSVLSVDAAAYRAEVMRALKDFSWETPDRTAARLFKARFNPLPLQQAGFALTWASGRVRDGRFTAAFRFQDQGIYQVLVSVPWPSVGFRRQPAAPEVIAGDLIAELSKPPTAWNEVEWSPMEQGLGPPRAAGQRWRPLTTA